MSLWISRASPSSELLLTFPLNAPPENIWSPPLLSGAAGAGAIDGTAPLDERGAVEVSGAPVPISTVTPLAVVVYMTMRLTGSRFFLRSAAAAHTSQPTIECMQNTLTNSLLLFRCSFAGRVSSLPAFAGGSDRG